MSFIRSKFASVVKPFIILLFGIGIGMLLQLRLANEASMRVSVEEAAMNYFVISELLTTYNEADAEVFESILTCKYKESLKNLEGFNRFKINWDK
ncbi:hypothetical protein [uncultured Pseudoteredinibacter sp.]|uniref:hypothetical protein n=1 Tax=uncultured Pseudoteredinibacter sp. TaxID=1641701 RepID=UPI00261488B6|nr:hypothetical protein [uncultured Pseudoteredinibacter sp.]